MKKKRFFRRHKIIKILYAFSLLLITASSIYFLIFSNIGFVRYHNLKSEFDYKVKKLKIIENEIKHIEKEVDGWKNDSYYVEKMAREELGMGHPNEIIYRLT